MSAAFLLVLAVRRQTRSLPAPKQTLPETTNLKPLFAPTDAELKREDAAEKAREIARREYHASAENAERVDAAINAWRAKRDTSSAIDLLTATAESTREGDLVRAANEIIDYHRESGIPGLAGNDLAALIDSHIRLLPNQERSSGAVFWLRQEVARLSTGNKS